MKHCKSPALLLSAVLLLLASCGSAEPTKPADGSTPANTEAPAETTALSPIDKLEKVDYNGETFRILCAAEQWAEKYVADGTNGEILNDAVYARNEKVSQLYNIDLQYEVVNGYTAGVDTVITNLQGSVMAGDMAYDLFVGSSAYVGRIILNGVFMNIADAEHLHLEEEWYYHNVNDQIRVGDKLYAAAGNYGLQTLAGSWSVFFNKSLAADLDIESPYKLVKDGKWTFDAMLALGKLASQDLNGDGKFTNEDRYGFLGTSAEPSYALPYGMGRTITTFDADGMPILTGATEQIINSVEKIGAMMSDKTLYYKAPIDPIEEVIPMFTAGQGLFVFYGLKFTERSQIRDAKLDFGILPTPKYNEQQADYLSLSWADICAIPQVVRDTACSEIIMEALNCVTHYDLYPTYKQIILQSKLSRDDESAEMIDLINRGATVDFGTIFWQSIEGSFFTTEAVSQPGQLASYWAKNEKKAEASLASILDTIRELP